MIHERSRLYLLPMRSSAAAIAQAASPRTHEAWPAAGSLRRSGCTARAQLGDYAAAQRERQRSAALEATQGRGRRAWALVPRGNARGRRRPLVAT